MMDEKTPKGLAMNLQRRSWLKAATVGFFGGRSAPRNEMEQLRQQLTDARAALAATWGDAQNRINAEISECELLLTKALHTMREQGELYIQGINHYGVTNSTAMFEAMKQRKDGDGLISRHDIAEESHAEILRTIARRNKIVAEYDTLRESVGQDAGAAGRDDMKPRTVEDYLPAKESAEILARAAAIDTLQTTYRTFHHQCATLNNVTLVQAGWLSGGGKDIVVSSSVIDSIIARLHGVLKNQSGLSAPSSGSLSAEQINAFNRVFVTNAPRLFREGLAEYAENAITGAQARRYERPATAPTASAVPLSEVVENIDELTGGMEAALAQIAKMVACVDAATAVVASLSSADASAPAAVAGDAPLRIEKQETQPVLGPFTAGAATRQAEPEAVRSPR